LPVVATDVGGNPEAVQDGVTGFLVRERTAEALAAPIIRLLMDGNLRDEMGRRGLERCRELFSLDRMIEEHEKYYSSLLGQSASSHVHAFARR
jgi:glycosyltransferase involved in cell wall biosynthesis